MAETSDGKDVRAEAREAAESAGQRVKAEGQRLAHEVRGSARGMVEQQQRSVAGYLHDVCDAVSDARQTLEQRGRNSSARLLATATDELDRVAANVSEHDAASLLHEVEGFARRQPAMFFAGALIAGFGVVRFLASTRPTEPAGRPAPYSVETYPSE